MADDTLRTVEHRPYPLPSGRWRMAQRWNDLLFAHWPVEKSVVQRVVPDGLDVDTYGDFAWLGVVPFWMDRVRTRVAGEAAVRVPGATSFPELNLRTYVRSRRTGLQGVYFYSLDAGSALAVLGARVGFHLPYFLASMRRETGEDGAVRYESVRRAPGLLRGRPAEFSAEYWPTGPVVLSEPGSLAAFLTERYCLFTRSPRGKLLVGHIHHKQWPLQPAEARIAKNGIAGAFGFELPDRAPLLHFSKELEVYLWSLREER